MDLPDRIEDMTKEQRMHLDMLVDQIDEEFPLDRMDEERLEKDHHLAILPSGTKVSTNNLRSFWVNGEGVGVVCYFAAGRYNELINLEDPSDVAAFNAALNDIGVYVAAPTLKGDDPTATGSSAKAPPHESATGAPV